MLLLGFYQLLFHGRIFNSTTIQGLNMIDTETAIIGMGPAGLSAALYTARAGIKTTVIGCSPKIAGDYTIDNYFGFPGSITGRELIEKGMEQVKALQTMFVDERVLTVHHGENGGYEIKTENQVIKTCSLILATGVSRTKPKISSLENFEGKGVSYCVSCDGFFYRNRKVIVIGESLFAANQAVELLQFTRNISIYTQGKEPDISQSFLEKLQEAGVPIIKKKITSLEGDGVVNNVKLDDGSSVETEGVFIAFGEASAADFALSLGLATSGSFITIDRDQKTSIPGIFAAGDCTGGFLQIAVAVGEGATAAKSAIQHVRNICR
jgi:thioredoxin reductase (NADPH)